MNGKGPLAPTEQALMRIHTYGWSTRYGLIELLAAGETEG
jgi:hypothetical protein